MVCMRAGHVSPYRTVQARAGVDSVVLRLSVKAVLRIWIRIHVFLGLLDPDPDPLVRGMDTDPGLDPSIIKQNNKENLDFYCFVTSF
jgi:hypothetical protein